MEHEKTVKKFSVRHFRAKKRKGEKIVALSLYDAPMASLAEECGVDLLLVGDSVGMAMLGYKTTIPVTIEQSLHHCAAVARGAKKAFVVGDMPFMTYRPSVELALKNAARYLQEAGVEAVKLEGGEDIAPTVARLVEAGVPVMGHVGLLPQNILISGGYRSPADTDAELERLSRDAAALQTAGAFCIVLECVPARIAERVSAQLEIPTIGIGSGPGCDGQIQVVHDILGLLPGFTPRHAKMYVNLSTLIADAFKTYAREVEGKDFPDPGNYSSGGAGMPPNQGDTP